jgi:hypothetical protein
VILHVDDVLVHRGPSRCGVAGFDRGQDDLVCCDDVLGPCQVGACLIRELLVGA